MALFSTSMSEQGFNVGMSMIEVLASNFHQDFGYEGITAKAEITRFIENISCERDRELLKNDIERLLEFETHRDMVHYLHICGASYWPLEENVEEIFRDALSKLQSP